MMTALVDGQPTSPQPYLVGYCPLCGGVPAAPRDRRYKGVPLPSGCSCTNRNPAGWAADTGRFA